jgi:predicted MFS family arabinose efflux permease
VTTATSATRKAHSPTSTASESPGYGRPSLPLLWAGQSVSLVGNQVTVLALPMVALAIGASVAQVALLVAATQAPFLLLGLPAGVWVRRIGLRRSMVLADLIRAAALVSLPVVAVTTTLTYRQLVLVAIVSGCGSVMFQVAYQSLTPLLVRDGDQLRTANTWLTASEALALIAGPAFAGLLTATVGALHALAVDAASYLTSAGTLLALRAPGDQPQPKVMSLRAEISGGLRYVMSNPPLRAMLQSSVLFNMGVAGYEALLVVFAIQHLGLSPAALGLAVGVGGAGVPLGLLVARSAERRVGVGPILMISGALSGAGLLVTGLAADPFSAPVIGLGTFITAVGGGAWGLTALTTRQTLSSSDMLPIATAVYRWATYGALPLGATAAGLAASLLGPRPAMLLAGAIGQLCVLPLLRPKVRRLRTLSSATAVRCGPTTPHHAPLDTAVMRSHAPAASE